MHVLITGATGTAGSAALTEGLKDPSVTRVKILVRKTTGIQNSKLEEILHSDFLNYPKDVFAGINGIVWDLGISQNAVTKDEYVKITYDFAMAAANAFFQVNPSGRFCFLSGQGADQTEKTFTYFGKIKGRTERELSSKFKDHVFHFRPGYIQPMHPRSPVGPLFAAILNRFTDKLTVTAQQLAICMLGVANFGSHEHIFGNEMIKRFQR